jgi:DNA-binding transcriptional regulator YhcF (GntR family)
MNNLVERSYKAIEKRGLISKNTQPEEFIDKMIEELEEIKKARNNCDIQNYIEECIDLSTVCFMQVHHMGYNPVEEFEKVVIKNENRQHE